MIEPANEDERVIIDFFTVLSTGDLERLRGLFTPDAAWVVMVKDVPGAGSHRGRDTIIDEFLGPVRGLFVPGDPKIEVLNVVARDGNAMAETRAWGTLADGRRYGNRYAWGIEVRDGKIHELREYMDSNYIKSLFP